MSYKLPIRNHRKRTIVLVASSLVVVLGIAAATALTLKTISPKRDTGNTEQSTANPADSKREEANKTFASGKYADALAQYKDAKSLYEAAGNTAAAADMTQQIAVVEATIKNTPPAPTQPRKSIGAGTSTR